MNNVPLDERRRYKRKPFVQSIKYYLPAPNRNGDRIYSYGDSVDVSEGGLGMITFFPLMRGDVLVFEPQVKINDLLAKSSVVRWVREIESNQYRVGLEFIR